MRKRKSDDRVHFFVATSEPATLVNFPFAKKVKKCLLSILVPVTKEKVSLEGLAGHETEDGSSKRYNNSSDESLGEKVRDPTRSKGRSMKGSVPIPRFPRER
jgi:hypothetical protein